MQETTAPAARTRLVQKGQASGMDGDSIAMLALRYYCRISLSAQNAIDKVISRESGKFRHTSQLQRCDVVHFAFQGSNSQPFGFLEPLCLPSLFLRFWRDEVLSNTPQPRPCPTSSARYRLWRSCTNSCRCRTRFNWHLAQTDDCTIERRTGETANEPQSRNMRLGRWYLLYVLTLLPTVAAPSTDTSQHSE